MVDVNVNAPTEQAPAMAPPTRTNDQILPRSKWVDVGKRNCYLDFERSQSNPIYKIAVDILKQTNFFRAFIASSTIPSIYIQSALQITPVDNNNAFTSPPTPDALIKFVNDLGYPKVGLKDQGLQCCRFFGASSIEPISIMQKGCGKNSPNPSIHSLKTKKKLAQHTQGKKKATIIEIPSVSAKGTKWEVFGMPIPNDLITDDIRGEQYYNAYLEKVAKHQRYLAGEEVIDPDSPAPKLAKATKHKATKKSKPSAPKAAPVTKPAVAKASKSQQTKSAPANPQEKKRKLVTEISEAPSLAKRSKAGKVTKKRKPKSSLQLINEGVDEGVLDKEPLYGDEEADTQRAIEESLKEVHGAHQGLLPPIVFREPDSGKFQPLPEVQGKGKEKVRVEQAAQVLLNLQTPKKKSPAYQYIFQRRTSTQTKLSGHDESSSLYAELGLTDSETDSDKEVPGIIARVQDEGQAGPNPGEHDEGQAGPNPGDVAASQPPLIHVVHAGPNLEHMDLEAFDTSIQPNPEQMDEEFTTTAYPNVQENLKLPTEGEVRLEEPASSAGTLSSLQHLDKELSFAYQFLAEKSQDDEPEKTNTESEVQ
ncbi:hypothetical protein Tco_0953150 [Tanacetum coccineum]|uniref:Uncharacterized protein n=1 Tax=Tanacetum coccineum TaxID=301880 RepID=A0ABQ5DZ17_9ASTR